MALWLVLTTTALALSGCTPTDRVSVRVVGGVLVFAICEPVSANALVVMATDPGDPSAGSTLADFVIWDARADQPVGLSVGQTIEWGQPPSGMENRLVASDGFTEHTYLSLNVGHSASATGFDDGLGATWRVSEISEDHWTDAAGRTSEVACPS